MDNGCWTSLAASAARPGLDRDGYTTDSHRHPARLGLITPTTAAPRIAALQHARMYQDAARGLLVISATNIGIMNYALGIVMRNK